jgi:hypothetical protein
MFRPISATEMEAALKDACVRNPLLAYAGPGTGRELEATEQLMTLVGCDEAADLWRLTGADLLAKEDRAWPSTAEQHRVFSTTLRYCQTCMHLGFHSMLFQHWGVTRCPLHGTALLIACTGCGLPIQPSVGSVLDNPYCCLRCHQLLVKTVAPPDCLEQVKLINSLAADWRRDLMVPLDGPQTRVSVAGLELPASSPTTSVAQRTRFLHRATAWPSPPTARWTHFREEQRYLNAAHTPANWRPDRPDYWDVTDRPTITLKWLCKVCDVPKAESFELFASSWMRIQFITPQYQNQQLSVLAVALHLTMTAYATQRINFHSIKADPKSVHPYVGASWNGVHATSIPRCYGGVSGELVAMEILGYFALSVLRCAGLNPVSEPRIPDGLVSFYPRSFCPSWQLSKEGRNWMMRMRSRANEKFVQRLIRRYKGKPLQRMVGCSAPTGYTLPNVVDLCKGRVPDELLHFPAGVSCKP